MNQDQFYEQLLIHVARMADATEIIARHLDPEAAKRLGKRLPDLRRPLAEYATFDWSSIGASVVARDRSGPTEVDYHGVICKRRSGEGRKGKAIWFNVVTGGTVDEGNITYERLITFRDSTPAEPLADQVAAHLQATSPATSPVAPISTTSSTTAATPAQTSPASTQAVTGDERTPTQLKVWFDAQVRRYDAARPVPPNDRAQVVEALNALTAGQAVTIIQFLCQSVDVRSMKYPCVQALRDWLKPVRQSGRTIAANAIAATEAAAVVAAQAPHGPPA